MVRIGNGSVHVRRFVLALWVIAAVFRPILYNPPVYVEILIAAPIPLDLLIETGYPYKISGFVAPGILHNLGVRIEIEFARPFAYTSLQCALHDVAAHVVCARVKPSIQQCRRMTKVIFSE